MGKEDALKVKQMKDANIDVQMKLEPYDYQRVGALFMYVVKKCFVLDDPGLGKTIESIAYIKMLQKYEKKPNVKVLVVTLSTTVYQWKDEVKKFSNLLPVVVDGGTKARETIYKNFKSGRQNVLITNYSKINYDFEKMRELKYDAIIFDEASSLKDNTTKSFQLYSILTQDVDRICMLTATPISNNLEEFYNLFQLFHNNVLPDYYTFRAHFLETKDVMVRKNGKKFTIQTVIGSKNIKEFREMVEPYFIRRENVKEGDFSNFKLNIVKYPVLLSREQKATLNLIKVDHLADRESLALKVYSDFSKVACCPCIYDSSLSKFSPKAIELIKLLHSLETKVVIFARFIEFHKILHEYLDLASISHCSITGEQSPKEKEKSKQQFNNDPNMQVILLTGAGKFGLNLQVSNKLVLLDMPYTPSDVFQLIGRVYRTGQKSDVTAYFMYNENSLEEDLFASLYRKQSEIDEFFDQSKANIFDLNLQTEIDVRSSFLSHNYTKGLSYDDTMDDKYKSLIPSNSEGKSDSGEKFYSMNIIL